MAEELEDVTASTEPEPEGTDLTPTGAVTDSGITLESVHAMLLELQGTVQNLQAVADQATPVEPNAEEPPAEEPPADESALLEDDGEEDAPAPEEDLEEVDKLLSAN